MPTTPTTAFGFGEKIGDPLTMYLSDVYTVSANLAGIPAIASRAGNTERDCRLACSSSGRSSARGRS